MIVTYNWLKEFVDFDLTPASLGDMLTMLGLEVEGAQTMGEGMDDVVVALIEERAQHPNADRLSLCKVNNGRETLTIVCGATNMKAGDKVALAQVGAVLPGDFKIKRSKIRGEESLGMLCSEKELGLAAESEGIMILPQDFTLGTPVFEAMGLKDTVFEIGLTPNRSDCLSVVGIAREIAAKLGKRVNYSDISVKESAASINGMASVTVEDPELCPRYTARHISGCRVAPSPAWLVNRLKAIGMRSINNVVDVTNYVLMEYGHPLHAFDFRLLQDGKIVVRRAKDGERFTTLDGQERTLKHSDLTICDGGRGVALAGIMGGENSEINDNTSDVFLESAYFEPMAIRRTSKRLGLHTESSHRFERGTDIDGLTKALNRAASLIAELSGGVVASGIIDVYPHKREPKPIQLRLDKMNRFLGLTLSADKVREILHNLEFVVDIKEPGVFDVQVPAFRVDIEREIDLVEEVARVNGYENIPVSMPRARVFSDRPPLSQRLGKKLKDTLVAHGLSEVINYSFIAPEAYEKILLGEDDFRRRTVKIVNPLSDDQSAMRTTLLPGLLETAAKNISYRLLNLRIFEVGRVFLNKEGKELPDEPSFAAGLISGSREQEGWNQQKGAVDFYDVKGIVEGVLNAFNMENITFEARDVDPFYHPGKSCTVFCRNEPVGSLGEIHPTVLENFDISVPVYFFELKFDALLLHSRDFAPITALSRFPDTFRDIAMLADEMLPAAAIIDAVKGLKLNEVEDVEIFDLYKGANIPEGKKSIAVRVRYRSYERTMTDDEASSLHSRIVENLINKLSVTLR